MDNRQVLSLVEGALKGDRTYQELLYRQFHGYGLGICLRYADNREEAVEILNDGFLKVFKNLERFDRSKPFIPWFRKILINAAINQFKLNKQGPELTNLSNGYHEAETNPSGLDNLQYEDALKMVQSLSPMYRTVFNLYVLEGFSHEEISEFLGISIGTSKSNLSRARAYLRRILKETYEEKYSGTDQ